MVEETGDIKRFIEKEFIAILRGTDENAKINAKEKVIETAQKLIFADQLIELKEKIIKPLERLKNNLKETDKTTVKERDMKNGILELLWIINAMSTLNNPNKALASRLIEMYGLLECMRYECVVKFLFAELDKIKVSPKDAEALYDPDNNKIKEYIALATQKVNDLKLSDKKVKEDILAIFSSIDHIIEISHKKVLRKNMLIALGYVLGLTQLDEKSQNELLGIWINALREDQIYETIAATEMLEKYVYCIPKADHNKIIKSLEELLKIVTKEQNAIQALEKKLKDIPKTNKISSIDTKFDPSWMKQKKGRRTDTRLQIKSINNKLFVKTKLG
ncbi:MAG: hypothetical protein AB1391_02365 [Candidatus Micrarchaeota archaeon]